MAYVLPLRCFLFLLPDYMIILVFIILVFSLSTLFSDEPEVLLPDTPKWQYFMLLTSGG